MSKILGAIVGDMVGSTREWNNVKTENFELLPAGSRFTDDTVMTLAVAKWLMIDPKHSEHTLVKCMQKLGHKYPNAGYGGMFRRWLNTENPEPYNSFGNGSAMRVSPVGLYASSLEEALELARITASVSHNHPEGIKGAQAVAACVYLNKRGVSKAEIKEYVESQFGYNLDINLRDIRDAYTFDVTCQGSVPIAIMAFLQCDDDEAALRLAISMGGDSDTIGAMTCSISNARHLSSISGRSYIGLELEERSLSLLTDDLLDINDRFIDFVTKPLPQSYAVTKGGVIFAGEYPGAIDQAEARTKIEHMYYFGVRHFIDLTEEGELKPYDYLLPKDATYHRFPIKDCCAPKSLAEMRKLLDKIDELKRQEGYLYIHCWGGVGRTGTVVACYLAKYSDSLSVESISEELCRYFSAMPKSAYRESPETIEQRDFIKRFVDDVLSKRTNN